MSSEGAHYPVVGMLKHRLTEIAKVDELFGSCNVIVTTMQAVSRCDDIVQSRMFEVASHLFIDEGGTPRLREDVERISKRVRRSDGPPVHDDAISQRAQARLGQHHL